jgi:hypothetical protein
MKARSYEIRLTLTYLTGREAAIQRALSFAAPAQRIKQHTHLLIK